MKARFHSDVLKQLQNLPREVFESALHAIIELIENPRPRGAKKLVGRTDWRIRLGQYRIVYEIDDDEQVVTIMTVAKRSDAYR
ncbi:type II toxin-antitoxin system RelE/ParE family toxin [Nocardia sp. NBC_01377]|uniref:type II toxin-antitoxin system RelE family toxin n=1 Tax=Nocardia sp. NBC_01377 TaxID=2903595 RepID=UPI003254A42F